MKKSLLSHLSVHVTLRTMPFECFSPVMEHVIHAQRLQKEEYRVFFHGGGGGDLWDRPFTGNVIIVFQGLKCLFPVLWPISSKIFIVIISHFKVNTLLPYLVSDLSAQKYLLSHLVLSR